MTNVHHFSIEEHGGRYMIRDTRTDEFVRIGNRHDGTWNNYYSARGWAQRLVAAELGYCRP